MTDPIHSSQPTDDQLAEELWNFHHLRTDLRDKDGQVRADALIVCGSSEDQVAVRAAELYRQGQIKKVVFSGGKVHERFEQRYGEGKTEAEVFAAIAKENGLPESAIILETAAADTLQNLRNSLKLLEEGGHDSQNLIIVAAPQHERRCLATAEAQLPGRQLRVTSPEQTFDSYINDPTYRTGRIRALMGHTLRLLLYGRKGDLTAQPLPESVISAYRQLLERGYQPMALDSIRSELERQGIEVDLRESKLRAEPHLAVR